MMGLSIWHWLVVGLIVLAYVVPMALVLRRVGYPGWLSVLIVIPVANLLFYWWLALAPWPDRDAR